MIHGVRLEQMPANIEFPPELAARISYSTERRELQFEGFMSKTDFDKLVRLHNDLAFQRALERLFQTCTFQFSAAPARQPRRPMVVTGVIAAVVVVMFAGAVLLWRVMHAHEAPTTVHNAHAAHGDPP